MFDEGNNQLDVVLQRYVWLALAMAGLWWVTPITAGNLTVATQRPAVEYLRAVFASSEAE